MTMQRVLGNLKRGKIFVVSAPAGTGKTTLVRMLCAEFSCVVESISYTTRDIRPGEISGVDYHFISQKEFEKKIVDHEFLEYAKVFDHYYGTSKKIVESIQNEGKHVILVIDTQGALQLKKHIPAVFIFISPPSIEELRRRLTSRKSDSTAAIEKRLSWAKKEMEEAIQYDYKIINEDLPTAYQIFRSILIAEEHRTIDLSRS